MSSNLIKTIVKRSRPRWPFQCPSAAWLPTLTVCLLGGLLLAQGQDPKLSNPTYPMDTNVSLGATVSFQVYASTTNGPLSYQWQHAGTNLPGATKNPLVLTNVTLAHAGGYQATIWNAGGDFTNTRTALLTVDPTFTKITTGPVVTDPGGWSGPNWWDYDNDGFLDLYVPTTRGRDGMYHNNGDGTFSSVTNAINRFLDDHMVGAVADYNNSGLASLLLVHWGNKQGDLYRNNSSGQFTKLMPFYDWIGFGCAGWADYDRDGFIDLFVALYNGSLNDILYHNNRNGTFTKMAANQVGGVVADNDTTAPCAWVDYDNDGWPDLWVGSGLDVGLGTSGRQYLWHNNRDGTFSRVSGAAAGSLTNDCATAFALWADYDNDGYPDVFLGAEWYGTTSLHHNDGGQTFTDVSAAAGVPHGKKSLVQAWGDYDNDGYLDLFVPAYFATNQSILYHNNGDGTFTSIDVGSPLRDGDRRQGTAWADYDNDGFLDLLITPYGDGATAKQLLYHNNGNGNAWLKVRLVGLASNRSAIGAKVRVQATIRGQTMWQMREINGNDGASGGACGLLAHFGLGDATQVTTLRIEWPSGIVQRLYNVAAGQFLTIVETANTPPVAQITVSPLAAFPGVTEKVVIAPNGTSAVVVFDGSFSSDVDHDPLQYWWIDGVNPIATGMSATAVLGIGSHPITLVVSDGLDNGTNSVTVEVVTPAQSVGLLMWAVEESELQRHRQLPLLATLRAAEAAFERGHLIAGLNQLHAFQNKVRAQVEPRDPALAEALVESAQIIIQAVGSSPSPRVKVPVQDVSRMTSE